MPPSRNAEFTKDGELLCGLESSSCGADLVRLGFLAAGCWGGAERSETKGMGAARRGFGCGALPFEFKWLAVKASKGRMNGEEKHTEFLFLI